MGSPLKESKSQTRMSTNINNNNKEIYAATVLFFLFRFVSLLNLCPFPSFRYTKKSCRLLEMMCGVIFLRVPRIFLFRPFAFILRRKLVFILFFFSRWAIVLISSTSWAQNSEKKPPLNATHLLTVTKIISVS